MRIGMFHVRKDPRNVTRAYLYAAIAKMEGIDFFYFTARGVDFNREVIRGRYYENGEWLMKEYPFPDIVMNVAYPSTEQEKVIYDRLKKKIPFTAHPVGDKLEVYRRIEKGEEFREFIIPYLEVKQPSDVIEFMKLHPKVVMKPVVGHHGDHLVYIERRPYDYFVRVGKKSAALSEMELRQYIQRMQGLNPMLIQKFITCKRKTGEPYDIRLLLSKNGKGKWTCEMYGKIGIESKVATNVNKGGKVTILSNFLVSEFQDQHHEIERYIEVFALQFASHFERLYSHDFDCLGIDVGLDENLKLWIYEVNWLPGQIFVESLSAKNAVLYARYVANKAIRRNHS